MKYSMCNKVAFWVERDYLCLSMQNKSWLGRFLCMVLILAVGTLAVPRYLQHQCNVHVAEYVHEGHQHPASHGEAEVFVHDGSAHVEASCSSCDVDLILAFEAAPRFDFKVPAVLAEYPSRSYSQPITRIELLCGSRAPPSRILVV